MAFTASTWGQARLLTGLSPGSSLSGFTAVITKANLPTSALDTGSLSCLNGGGDWRFSTDINGTNQVPLDLDPANCVTSATPSNTKFIGWIRFPTYASGTREIYAFWNKAGQSQPIPSAAFGSEDVYQDFRYVSHDGITDSTGNSTITQFGSPTAGTGHLGSPSVILNGTTQYGRASSARTPTGAGYYSTWIKDTNGASDGCAVGSFKSTASFDWESTGVSGSLNARGLVRRGGNGTSTIESSTTYTTNNWIESTLNLIGIAEQSEYLNGAGKTTDTTSRALSGETYDRLTYGRCDDSSPSGYVEGEMAEMWVSDTSKTDDFISSRYANISDPSTFWTAGAVFVPGGGANAAITIPKPVFSSSAESIAPVFNAAVNFTVSKPVFASTAQSIAPITSGDVNFTIGKPEFSATAQAIPAGSGANADITISKPVFASTAQSIAPIITADVAFSITAPIFSATAQSLGLSTSADVSITISKPEFSATAQAIGVDNNAAVSFNIASPIFSVFAGGAVLEYYYAKDTQIVLIEKSKIITAPNKSRTLGV
jgi:hypothetical protein